MTELKQEQVKTESSESKERVTAGVLTYYVARWVAINPPVKEHFKMAQSVNDLKRLFYNRCKNYITNKEAFKAGASSIDWNVLYKLIEGIK